MSVRDKIKSVAYKMPLIRELLEERNHLCAELEESKVQHRQLEQKWRRSSEELNENKKNQGFVPPGHFYSPVPDFDEIREKSSEIFEIPAADLPGIEFYPEAQMELLGQFQPFYAEMNFSSTRQEGFRYYYENPAYSYSDAILLHCMLRHVQPKRVIEIGSGFSSCMTLDTNELFFDGAIEATFIEPYPELLHSLLKKEDQQQIKVIPHRLQDVDLEVFSALQANDVLFVDSTHVSKIDSDVNRILFEVLPVLASGVYIHFHDIFFPFEYPQEWVLEGRAWNEAYALKAFLQYNREFPIVLMNTYMQHFHREFFEKDMPLCLENPGGSIWLKKV